MDNRTQFRWVGNRGVLRMYVNNVVFVGYVVADSQQATNHMHRCALWNKAEMQWVPVSVPADADVATCQHLVEVVYELEA